MPGSELRTPAPSPLLHRQRQHHQPSHNFASAPHRATHHRFLTRLQCILTEYLFEGTRRQSRVSNWKDPDELKEVLDLEVRRSGSSHETILQLVKQVINYSVTIGHPYFLNQLFSSVDPYGLAGQWLGDVLNPSVYTYEVAPVFTLMEETVLAAMRNILGYTGGDGIFCPGGSIANGYAINCARYHKFPQVKTKGLSSVPRLVVLTSEEAHYSIKKMASLEGIGSDNVYLVRTSANGKMDVQHLEQLVLRAIEEKAVPFMVSATAGTTVLGAFDPIDEIWEVCSKYKMWLHVDAAWGGGALMSKKHRHLLSSIEKADSVTWNPHKMLAAPQQCSTMLTKHEGLLSQCHSASAQYLFQKDKFYDTAYDTGDKHVQCGRRADVLKFWLMWKAKGSEGLEKHVDTLFDNAKYLTEAIRNREGFELVVHQPECTNVTFWYLPPSLRNSRHTPDFAEKLHKVAPLIKERMMREGTMMMTYQPHKHLPNFFRLVLQNSSLNRDDMDHIIYEIERLGRDL